MTHASSQRFSHLVGIYNCTAFLVYSRSLLVFFWELPSLLLRFSSLDIIGFLSYELAFSLIESVIVTFFVIVFLSLIPSRRIRENMSVVGGLIVWSFAASAYIFKGRIELIQWLRDALPSIGPSAGQFILFLWLFITCSLPSLAILIVRHEKNTLRIKAIIENLSVLAGLYTALSVLGILVIILRNLS